ncbi:MAG TPA: hypothetical protein VEU55_01125 [Gemmatimonadales bacterium]|nr:hypothetical protein [Gemmatimonadales bacterium]
MISFAPVLGGGIDSRCAQELLSAAAIADAGRAPPREAGDHAHQPYLIAALDWLLRALPATGGGSAPAGATGDIIPTLYRAARHLGRADLARHADRAAQWALEVQLPSGAVRAGAIGLPGDRAVSDTGCVLRAWLAAFVETGCGVFAGAARRAGRYLLATLGEDNLWQRDRRGVADTQAARAGARTAWALAEAGRRLGAPEFRAAAARALRAIAGRQRHDGWIPDLGCPAGVRPRLDTVAATVRGLLEGGRTLGDERLIARAALTAERVAGVVGPDGRLAGRIGTGWRPAVSWTCLAAAAQMANTWLRLREITGDVKWVEPAVAVVGFLKSTQNRASGDVGLRGGIVAATILGRGDGPRRPLTWATKHFVDALIGDESRRRGGPPGAAEGLA